MYLIPFTVAYIFCYIIFIPFFQKFFDHRIEIKNNIKTSSILIILLLSIILGFIIFAIRDEELANRFQHAIFGGTLFSSSLFLSLKDSKVKINLWKSSVIIFLLTTTFGVFNELLEFWLQSFLPIRFATSIEDTWLDLASNAVGILVAIFIFYSLVLSKANRI